MNALAVACRWLSLAIVIPCILAASGCLELQLELGPEPGAFRFSLGPARSNSLEGSSALREGNLLQETSLQAPLPKSGAENRPVGARGQLAYWRQLLQSAPDPGTRAQALEKLLQLSRPRKPDATSAQHLVETGAHP